MCQNQENIIASMDDTPANGSSAPPCLQTRQEVNSRVNPLYNLLFVNFTLVWYLWRVRPYSLEEVAFIFHSKQGS